MMVAYQVFSIKLDIVFPNDRVRKMKRKDFVLIKLALDISKR